MDISSDDEGDEPANAQESANINTIASSSHSRPSSRAPSPSTSPSRPPSSASEHISPDDDFDIDALIRAEGQRAISQPPPPPASKPNAAYGKPRSTSLELVDRDEAMWDDMMRDDAPPRPRVVPAENLFDDDEDMWDVIREMEKDPTLPPLPVAPDPGVEPANAPMDDEEDFDSMFL